MRDMLFVALVIFGLIVIMGLFEVGGPALCLWLYDRLMCRIRPDHAQVIADRHERQRQLEEAAAEKRRLHPIRTRILTVVGILGPPIVFLGWIAWENRQTRQRDETQQLLRRLADDALQQVTQGHRLESGPLPERDAWGQSIELSVAEQGGTTVISVRSSGRDQVFQTRDDIVVNVLKNPPLRVEAERLFKQGLKKAGEKAIWPKGTPEQQ